MLYKLRHVASQASYTIRPMSTLNGTMFFKVALLDLTPWPYQCVVSLSKTLFAFVLGETIYK